MCQTLKYDGKQVWRTVCSSVGVHRGVEEYSIAVEVESLIALIKTYSYNGCRDFINAVWKLKNGKKSIQPSTLINIHVGLNCPEAGLLVGQQELAWYR